MDHLQVELKNAVKAWDEREWPRPHVMVVSGSGLGTELGEPIAPPCPWSDLLPFRARGIEGHPLQIELLRPPGGPVVLYSRGRLHAYQGFTPAQVVFPVRLAALLGIQVLVLTNSAGGLLPSQRPGDLVVLNDHINMTGMNPLWGNFPTAWGPQFPDMSSAYDPRLRQLMLDAGREHDVELSEGVYVGVGGPSYETPAEVRMMRQLGAHVVGMSTVMEVIAAHHMGVRCAGLSFVSNPAAGVTDEVLEHDDVLERGQQAAAKVRRLLAGVVSHPDLLS